MLWDEQFTCLSILHWLPFMVMFFPSLIKGQAVQLESLHLFMPFCILSGYLPWGFATAALIKWLLIFGWHLKAVNGGLWNTSARYLFLFVIERQCFICRLGIDGNLGSYGVANTGLLFSFFCDTFLSNFSLGILLALLRLVFANTSLKICISINTYFILQHY